MWIEATGSLGNAVLAQRKRHAKETGDMTHQLEVLLVEDDEDDYILIEALLSEASSPLYHLDWVSSYDKAIEAAGRARYDVFLLDYRLGNRNGMELFHELVRMGLDAPVIFLTGRGDYDLDMEAMKAGAADYLVKGELSAHLLERSIRYSIERKRSQEALQKSQKQLKYLSSQLLKVQENERKRIAGELHDDLGQILTAIKYGVEHTIDLIKRGAGAPEPLEALIPTIQHAIEEVRRIYTCLRPSLLDDLGIVATIGWYCREFGKMHPRIDIQKHIRVQEEDVPERLRVVIYRVIQEAMNNIAQHSEADYVNISLEKKGDLVELIIGDNGRGFNLTDVPSEKGDLDGLGIVSMKERVELTGGRFEIQSTRGGGSTIRASWNDG